MENQAAASQTETSKLLDSKIRRWLVVLGEAYQFVLPPQTPAVWLSALTLGEVLLETVDAAFQKLLRTWAPEFGRKFPVPADFIAILDEAKNARLADEAETAWHGVMKLIPERYHPDIGWSGPPLAPRMDHAVRAAGGVRWLWACSQADLVWGKKRFTECYLRDEVLQDTAALLPAPQIMQLLKPVAERKRFAAANPPLPAVKEKS